VHAPFPPLCTHIAGSKCFLGRRHDNSTLPLAARNLAQYTGSSESRYAAVSPKPSSRLRTASAPAPLRRNTHLSSEYHASQPQRDTHTSCNPAWRHLLARPWWPYHRLVRGQRPHPAPYLPPMPLVPNRRRSIGGGAATPAWLMTVSPQTPVRPSWGAAGCRLPLLRPSRPVI